MQIRRSCSQPWSLSCALKGPPSWWVPIHGYLPEYFSGLARYQKRFPLSFVRDEGPIAGSHQKSLGVVHIDVCSSLSGGVCSLCPSLGSLCWLQSLLLKPEKPKHSLRSRKRRIPKAKSLLPPSAVPTLFALRVPKRWGTQWLFLPWMQKRTDVSSPSGGCRAQPDCPFGSCPHLPTCSQPDLQGLRFWGKLCQDQPSLCTCRKRSWRLPI